MKAESLHSLMRDMEASDDDDSRIETLRRLKSMCLLYYSGGREIDFRKLLEHDGLGAASPSCRFNASGQVIEDYLKVIKKFLEEEKLDEKIEKIKLPIIRNASTSSSFYNKIFEEINRAYPNLTSMTLIFEEYKYINLIFSISVNINFPNIRSLEIIKTKLTGTQNSNQTRCLLKDRELDVDDIILRFPNVEYLHLERATVFFGKSRQYLKPRRQRKNLHNLKGLTFRFVKKSINHLLEMAPNLYALQITFIDGELFSGYKHLRFLERFKIKHLNLEVNLQSRGFKIQQPNDDLALTKTSTNESLNIFDRKIIPLFKNIENISFISRDNFGFHIASLNVEKKSDEEEGAAAAVAAEDNFEEEEKKRDKDDECSFCGSYYEESIDYESIDDPTKIIQEFITPLKYKQWIEFQINNIDRERFYRFIHIFNHWNWLKQF